MPVPKEEAPTFERISEDFSMIRDSDDMMISEVEGQGSKRNFGGDNIFMEDVFFYFQRKLDDFVFYYVK